MESVTYLFIPAVIGIAIISTFFINKFSRQNITNVRYPGIDGLRGYLALFVFLHHSLIWFFYLQTQVWQKPPSHLFEQFGSISVSLFFMITAFLFFRKLLNARGKQIDWIRFFRSRFFRLAPMYFFSVCLVFLIVSVLSGFTLRVSSLTLAKSIFYWLSFGIIRITDINEVKDTKNIIAGVVWSLAWEWIFYLLLPVLGIIFFRLKNYITAAICFLLLGIIFYERGFADIQLIIPFGGGIVAAFIADNASFQRVSKHLFVSLLIVVCLALSVVFFESAYNIVSQLLISVAFIFIAGGNSMFGILHHRISRVLGQWAYSMYLLHGILLFVCFQFVLGKNAASHFSLPDYWFTIICCVPILLFVCHFTFRFIESPFIEHGSIKAER